MSSNNANNDSNGKSSGAPVSWGTKAGYIGTGVMIGLIIYPFVRKAVTKFQPKMDRFFDDLTGKAEGLAERAADLMARAKDNLAGDKDHDHDHGGGHAHAHGKQKSSAVQ